MAMNEEMKIENDDKKVQVNMKKAYMKENTSYK